MRHPHETGKLFSSSDRKFVLALCRLVNESDSDLSRRDKMRLRTALFISPAARAKAREYVQDGLLGLGITKGFGAIDWENFDWEAAKEFWVEILKVLAEVLILFI
jgi:hypothetical protein